MRERGPDPRPFVANTLRVLESWDNVDYSGMIADVEEMTPDATICGLCGFEECQPRCPMERWRGQQ